MITIPIYFPHFFMALRPNAGHGLLILVVSRSYKRHTTVGRTPLDEWSQHASGRRPTL